MNRFDEFSNRKSISNHELLYSGKKIVNDTLIVSNEIVVRCHTLEFPEFRILLYSGSGSVSPLV